MSTQTKRPILTGTGPDVLAYISALKPGEEVVETGGSCMQGMKGTVYLSNRDQSVCVMWKMGGNSRMGTSVTWGTRRLADA